MNQIEIVTYNDDYWVQIKEIILNAENFGEFFLENEKKIIETFSRNPDYGLVLVALNSVQNIIVGYACIEKSWRSFIIKSLVVHQNHLRKGIGSKIIQNIKDLGEKTDKINVLRVDTGDFMIYAQRFYLANDFIVSGHVSHDMSWFNTQIHFSLPLKGNSVE